MNMLADILLCGILWVLCSLPLITCGAATTAAYYAMAKSVRHKEGYLAREFFRSFKANLKQMLILGLFFWIIAIILAVEIVMCWMNEGTITNAFFVIEVGLMLLLFGHAVWVCPLVSRFNKNNVEVIKTAAFVMFKYLPITVAVLILFFASVVGIYMTRGFGAFFLPGICMFISSLPIEWVLRKMMPPVDPDSEEGQKWYYQDFKRKKDNV